jgi:phosphohistidine phosphatase SixA
LSRRKEVSASEDFATLWTHIKDEVDHLAHDVERTLKARGAHEAELLTRILEIQREAIKRAIGGTEKLRVESSPRTIPEGTVREGFE